MSDASRLNREIAAARPADAQRLLAYLEHRAPYLRDGDDAALVDPFEWAYRKRVRAARLAVDR